MVAACQNLRHKTLDLPPSTLVLLEDDGDESAGFDGRVWWDRHMRAACSQNGENVIDGLFEVRGEGTGRHNLLRHHVCTVAVLILFRHREQAKVFYENNIILFQSEISTRSAILYKLSRDFRLGSDRRPEPYQQKGPNGQE